MIKRAPVLTSALLFALTASAQTTTPATTPTPPATSTATPTAAPADPPMPKDPNALMQLAARVNGLGSPDMKPWHLKANYQTFDADGKPKDQGVFEEWWASPEKYKVSYSSPTFNQVQYHNGGKTLMTGDTKWPPQIEAVVEQYLLHPLPPIESVEKLNYIARDAKDRAVQLNCLHPAVPQGYTVGLTYCFGKDIPAIRIEAPYPQRMVFFNDVVTTNHHYLAKDIQVLNESKPWLNENVLLLEFPPAIDDATFVAPTAAVAAPVRKILVSAGVIAGNRISGTEPEYPAIARAARVEGAVVLQAIITTDGKIEDVKVISGPPMLQQAAVDAVYTWRYKPYLLNGQPVTIQTQLNVVFALARKK